MPDNFATVDVPLTPALAQHLNDVCDRFEAAWKATTKDKPAPRIEEYLADMPGPELAVLLRHLVLLDIDYRRLRGDRPTALEYEARFSSLSGRLADAFAGSPSEGHSAPSPLSRGDGGAAPEPAAEHETTVYSPPFEPQLRSQRYLIQQFHARGGVGEIWLATDKEIGRQVALKCLREEREAQRDRFLVEAQITGQLEHPGIVPVHDLGVDEAGRPFYVMSFIHGRTLKEVIEEYHAGGSASAEPREVQGRGLLEVFVKVCHAVAYAHHRGVIHRDLKPDNVMIGPFGEALVLDWGMAKARGQAEPTAGTAPVQPTYLSGSMETQAGAILGSPAYMAPEAAEGRAADERTDVYLLGATLYHILTGRLPHQGGSLEKTLKLARTVPPPSPRRLKADIPRALEAVCLKAMARRKQDRYGSALELAKDMERYLAGAPVSAYREPVLIRAGRWCKQHRRALGRSLTAALALAAALVGAALVHDAWNTAEAKGREADELRRSAQARDDLEMFRRLAEERQFYAAVTTPAGDSALSYDSGRSRTAGREAVAVAYRLTEDMKPLPLPAERASLDRELHDLLLLMAQAQSQQATGPDAAADILEGLDRAASLGGPSRGYYRVQARCHRALGEEDRAAKEDRAAEKAPPTALDHFLEAEEYRTRAGAPAETSGDGLAWRPNPELLRKAVAEYQLALRLKPDDFWCHLQMGRCCLSLGQGPEAVAALGACVALRPKAPWGYSARGLALGLIKRYADGEADLDKALLLDPQFRPALLHRGILAWLQRKDEQALADFARVLGPPGDEQLIEAAYYRGQLRLQRKEYLEALKDFDLVVKENPGFRPAYLSRAQAQFLRGDNARGLADLTTFLDMGLPEPFDPKDPKLLAQRGRLLLQVVPQWGLSPDEYKAVLELTRDELETARRMGYRSPELFDDLGSVRQRLGQWDEALAAYEQSLPAAPPDLAVKIRTKRGWIYTLSLKTRELDKARDDFAEALRLDPSHADAHAGLGYVLALQKSPGEAQVEAAEALFHEADDYLVLHNVACIYAELSQIEKGRAEQHQNMAMDLLRRAVQVWRRDGVGPSEIDAIWLDPSLKVLQSHPDFEKLCGDEGE
jgi:tetratricopeptide (TPR) repeat protein/tRNA A-37 threonylcarbamoyl transferase component Bud32